MEPNENTTDEPLGNCELQRQNIELLQRIAALTRALRMKDEFLANISHELRTPMTSILGMAESLRMDLYGPLTEEQRTSVGVILDSGQHLLSLINTVLDLAKIEAGKMELHSELLDITDCCLMAVKLIKHIAYEKGIQISQQIDEDIQTMTADPLRVKQMLVNLLSNAVKFTPHKGKVGLEVTGDRAAGVVTFTVWDTGIGIAADQLPLLFQPFMQLENRMPRQYTGTGLGLSLVRRIAELHGGCVTVDSAPGEGSRFTISLPWLPEEEPVVCPELPDATAGPTATVDEAARPTSPASAATLLLVDDDEIIRKQLAKYLASLGYRVLTAAHGGEGVRCAEEMPPAVIIMDVQMPEMDGLEATRHLRGRPATATIPIIALTALVLPGTREQCLDAGMTEYLTKPVNFSLLRETVERYAGRGIR